MTRTFLRCIRSATRLVILLAVGALSSGAPVANAQEVDWNRIDSTIEGLLAEWTTPGVAVAVVQDDSVVFAKGYGVRRLGEPGPVGPETRLAVASNTKAFTAALLAQQHAEVPLGVRALDERRELGGEALDHRGRSSARVADRGRHPRRGPPARRG